MSEAAVAQAPEVVALAPLAVAPAVPMSRVGMAEILFDEDKFRQTQRVAKMLIQSPLVPEAIRGKNPEEGMANIILAFALAMEMRENPLIVMQNVYFVKGTPGWRTQYVIAKANRHRVFSSRIRWVVEKGELITITRKTKTGWDNQARKNTYKEEKRQVQNVTVTAVARLADTGEEANLSVDLVLAEAEGWTENEKYHSMPEHMLKWRSAAMLIRLHAPEVMLGYPTVDELETMPAAAPIPVAAPRRPSVESSTSALMGALDIPATVSREEMQEFDEPGDEDREPGSDG